jgi:ketosteroid isomerase-like protein
LEDRRRSFKHHRYVRGRDLDFYFSGCSYFSGAVRILVKSDGLNRACPLRANVVSLRDDTLKMRHRAIALCVSLLLFSQQLPAIAENSIVSQVATASATPSPLAKTDTELVYEVLVKMLDRWNAHDVDGLMSVYWNSPRLLAVIDTEQFDGWENLYRSYKNQCQNPTDMGIVNPTRFQVKLLQPDLAFVIVSWSMKFPENEHASEIVGTTTMDIQKFDSDWKIVVLHTSFTEM